MEIEIQKISPTIRFQIPETIAPATAPSVATELGNDIFLWVGGAILVISVGLVVIKLAQNKKKKSLVYSKNASMLRINSLTHPMMSIIE